MLWARCILTSDHPKTATVPGASSPGPPRRSYSRSDVCQLASPGDQSDCSATRGTRIVDLFEQDCNAMRPGCSYRIRGSARPVPQKFRHLFRQWYLEASEAEDSGPSTNPNAQQCAPAPRLRMFLVRGREGEEIRW